MNLDLPVPVLPAGARSWPLHGAPASRAVEQAALAGLPPHTLMRRAGLAVARLALAIAPHAQRIWVAAGPGNNGGDGLHAAIALQAAGKQVQVSLLADPLRLPDDARDAHAAALQAGVPISADPTPPAGCALAIDALLGLGSSRPAQGALAAAVEALNRSSCPVLAVDLPSGLHASHGTPLGGIAVHATHTLALLTLKPGLFTGAGRDHAGRVWLDTLGVETAIAPDARLGGGQALTAAQPARRHTQHKGSFGDTIVVGGAAGMTGAAWLAARAALVAGAGRVYLDTLSGDTVPSGTPELMQRPGLAGDPRALGAATVVCGCGGANAVAGLLPAVLQHSRRLVLDADGLNALAGDPALQALLVARGARALPSLLTPHPLEAGRLLGQDAAAVQADRFGAAQALAERFGCAVLLKGSGSLCAAPGQLPWVNPTGNALLASAGTGDVLAGWAGGLWSQRPNTEGPPSGQAQAVGAAAAWLHGHAADLALDAGRTTPLVAGSLIDAMAVAASR